MRPIEELRTGDIYWLDNCPPLEGQVAKRRPVIVVSPPDRLTSELLVLVVATSTTALASEKDRIALPSLEEEPQSKARLPKKCWAVPRWHLVVRRESLQDYIGYVSARLQRQIVAAVLRRMGEQR